MEPPANVHPAQNAESLRELESEIIPCRRCPRLVDWRERMAREKRRAFREQEYWGRPVPGFGDPQARVIAVGLAPGAHGSNRTGRMFTGDGSGDFLYPALYRAGLASRPDSLSREDGLTLPGLFLTAVCRCAPPDNKPSPGEIRNCLPFLEAEFRLLPSVRVVVALGKIAYDAVAKFMRNGDPGQKLPAFAHGVMWRAHFTPDEWSRPIWMIGSYHPSRQNTQTGRLTQAMFGEIWRQAVEKTE